MSFQKKVYDIVRQIPKGQVMTYKQVAEAIENPNSARVIGNALNKNHNPLVPCHRVIRSDGSIGGYNRGSLKKVKLLTKEGYLK